MMAVTSETIAAMSALRAMPTGEWIPVDPSIGDQGDESRRNCFGNLDNGRVAVAKTFDVRLKGGKGGHQADFLQFGVWWWRASKIRTAPSAKFTMTGRPA